MEHYLKKIKKRGLKLTPLRIAIIKMFMDNDSHMTPEDTWSELKDNFRKCGLPSIYRNLESMVECGILTRIQLFDRKKHYGLCNSKKDHHHHHIVCIKCGKVDAISGCALNDKREINGYQVVSHYVQINGICENCS